MTHMSATPVFEMRCARIIIPLSANAIGSAKYGLFQPLGITPGAERRSSFVSNRRDRGKGKTGAAPAAIDARPDLADLPEEYRERLIALARAMGRDQARLELARPTSDVGTSGSSEEG